MMKNYSENELKNMSNKELEHELTLHDWLHRDLLYEYDQRCNDGRIKFTGIIQPEELEDYFKKRQKIKYAR